MKLYRNKDGKKLYPVCNWEHNQHKLKSREEFWKYLAKCGWGEEDIATMWKMAKGKEGVSK